MKTKLTSALLLSACAVVGSVSYGQEASKTTPENYTIIHKSTPNENGVIRCHTMEADSILRAKNSGMPDIYEYERAFQYGMKKYQEQLESGKVAKKQVITIPIVFHIITDGSGAENIAATYIQAQVDQLNLDYRNLAGSTYPTGVAADLELNFCLAQIDPSGTPLAEPGINRVTAYGDGPFGQTNFDNTIKPGTIWDPTQYCNIWVGDLSGGLLGYAQFPEAGGLAGIGSGNGNSNTDGVVILYSSVGSVATPFPGGAPYNLGRTLTHELGHWLGLRHVWGDGGCSVDDFCNDTPKSDNSNFGCPNTNSCTDSYGAPWPTANPADMVENYMDYTDDSCMDTFTEDQKTRVAYVMANSVNRMTLGASTACNVATDPDDAGISSIVNPDGTICASSFTPEIELTNYGTNALTTVTITYGVDGATNTFNWTGNLASGASTTVTLPVQSPATGAHTFDAATSLPNGNTDPNTGNDASTSNFTITIGEVVTFTLSTDCYGEETVYELFEAGTTNLVATGGNQNVTIPVTSTQNTSAGDPGAYPNETTITEEWCLTAGQCYDFVLWDAYGDGINGSSVQGCNTDGDYTISDANGVLASMVTPNGAFTFSETNSFCLASPCTSTYDTPQTATETCFGDNTGEITVNQTGGNTSGTTFDIGSGASTNNVFSNLAQGSYTITVVDGDACTSILNVTVSGPAELTANAAATNISCNGQVDGGITVTTTGGTGTLSYDFGSGAQASNTVNGLAANTYTVTVADANGCTVTANTTISEPAVLGASAGTITPELGGNDGSVQLNVTGGTANFTYAWSGPNGYTSTAQNPSNMAGGTYSVTVTDANGCTTTVTDIFVPSQLGIETIGAIEFNIYPNPSNGTFNVQLVNGSEMITKVFVTDVAGRVVMEDLDINKELFKVDMTNAANGTYMLNVVTENAIFTKRIVVRK